jgi:hypothetical protein
VLSDGGRNDLRLAVHRSSLEGVRRWGSVSCQGDTVLGRSCSASARVIGGNPAYSSGCTWGLSPITGGTLVLWPGGPGQGFPPWGLGVFEVVQVIRGNWLVHW